MPLLGLDFKLSAILPTEGKVIIEVRDKQPKRDYVVVQALVFPGIQLVWVGCTMMMFGLLLSGIIRVRNKKKKREEVPSEEEVIIKESDSESEMEA